HVTGVQTCALPISGWPRCFAAVDPGPAGTPPRSAAAATLLAGARPVAARWPWLAPQKATPQRVRHRRAAPGRDLPAPTPADPARRRAARLRAPTREARLSGRRRGAPGRPGATAPSPPGADC